MIDYRDMVITDLSDENVLLRERVSSLEADVVTYRDVMQQAIHALASVTAERDKYRRRLFVLLDERREPQRAA